MYDMHMVSVQNTLNHRNKTTLSLLYKKGFLSQIWPKHPPLEQSAQPWVSCPFTVIAFKLNITYYDSNSSTN